MALTAISAGAQAVVADLNQYKNHLEGASGATSAWFLRCATSENFIVRLSDASGVQKLSVQDSAGVEVAAIDSNGNMTLSGTFTPGTITLPTGTAPTPTAEGEVWWDSDDDKFVIGNGVGQTSIGAGTTDHGALTGLADDDHTTYLKEKASGGTAAETPVHDHSAAGEAGTIAHSATTGKTADDHHAQSHTVASHSDTTATGAELETLTDGSTTALHVHSPLYTILNKTADQALTTSSTTLQSVSGFSFSVSANREYRYELLLLSDAPTTPDIKLQWSLPASAVHRSVAAYRTDGGTSNVAPWGGFMTSALAGGTVVGTVEAVYHITGTIVVAGTGGTAQLQAAQNTSDAGTVNIKVGTWMLYELLT